MTGKRYAGKAGPGELKTKSPGPAPVQPPRGRKTLLVSALAVLLVVAVGLGCLVFKDSSGTDPESVLHFSFDKVRSGSIRNTGNGGAALDGIVLGRPTISSDGKFGKALTIDGTGGTQADNIVMVRSKVVDTDAKGSWTVALWVKTTGSRVAFLYQGDGYWKSRGPTTWFLGDGKPSAVRDAGGWWFGSKKVNDGQWHHIAYVDDAGNEILYVDGSVDRLTSRFSNPMAADANQLWIGGSPDGGDGMSKINGCIDELWMFNRALNASEVRSLMTDNRIK